MHANTCSTTILRDASMRLYCSSVKVPPLGRLYGNVEFACNLDNQRLQAFQRILEHAQNFFEY